MISIGSIGALTISAAIAMQSGPQQATLEEAMSACRSITESRNRLECFDSLARAVETVEERGVGTQASKAGASDATAKSSPPLVAAIPQSAPNSAAPEKPDSSSAEPTAANTASAEEKRYVIIPKSDRRAKLVRGPFNANIVKIWLRSDKIYVRLDNGETWKQTSRNRPRMPKPGQEARFTKGFAGGWFASFGKSSRKISVALVE